jgi:hypothetical protein
MFFPVFFRRFYIGFSALLLVVIGGMAVLPRGDIEAHAERRPAFDLAEFFTGKSVAYGIFEDRFGNLRRQFRVEIEASQSGNILTLDERFLYADGEQDRRIWKIEKYQMDGEWHYRGRAEDITGEATGRIAGNAMSWQYDIVLQLSGVEMQVSFDDFIYQIDDDIALNRAYVSKWGIDIGAVTLVFLKDELAQEKLPLNLKNW